jgi:uncharacterized paraquat-inducible protein A
MTKSNGEEMTLIEEGQEIMAIMESLDDNERHCPICGRGYKSENIKVCTRCQSELVHKSGLDVNEFFGINLIY